MRVAIITESFLPDINGVAHSVVRVAEHLVTRGHRPLVIAPEPASGTYAVTERLPYPVTRIPSIPTPAYRRLRLGLPSSHLITALHAHRADVVHLASPFILGAYGMRAALSLNLPTIAVYQTDMPAYIRAYGFPPAEAAVWKWLRRIHNTAGRTLAGSTATAIDLATHGIERIWLWRRGVDTERFDPRHRSTTLRQALATNGEVLVGYVGRLATEKCVNLLTGVSRLPGVKLIIVGDGPERRKLTRLLPQATFLGSRSGHQLARLYASFDLFVHSGPYETFGQTIQEALASGLPVIAPAAGGPLDLVHHGQTGLLVKPHDAHAITTAVQDMIANPTQLASFAAAARSSVAERTWAHVGDELISHYEAVQPSAAPDIRSAIPTTSFNLKDIRRAPHAHNNKPRALNI